MTTSSTYKPIHGGYPDVSPEPVEAPEPLERLAFESVANDPDSVKISEDVYFTDANGDGKWLVVWDNRNQTFVTKFLLPSEVRALRVALS